MLTIRHAKGFTELAHEDFQMMDLTEFRDKGYLQELNRRFLHPLGLALCMTVLEDKVTGIHGIWDYRNDPEGIIFAPEDIDWDQAAWFDQEKHKRLKSRFESIGFIIQERGDDVPCGGSHSQTTTIPTDDILSKNAGTGEEDGLHS